MHLPALLSLAILSTFASALPSSLDTRTDAPSCGGDQAVCCTGSYTAEGELVDNCITCKNPSFDSRNHWRGGQTLRRDPSALLAAMSIAAIRALRRLEVVWDAAISTSRCSSAAFTEGLLCVQLTIAGEIHWEKVSLDLSLSLTLISSIRLPWMTRVLRSFWAYFCHLGTGHAWSIGPHCPFLTQRFLLSKKPPKLPRLIHPHVQPSHSKFRELKKVQRSPLPVAAKWILHEWISSISWGQTRKNLVMQKESIWPRSCSLVSYNLFWNVLELWYLSYN